MTLVLGQKFLQGIVLVSDSRASRYEGGKFSAWRDNTQKIFRLSKNENLFIGFSGDIEFAGTIILFLIQQLEKRPKLAKIQIFRVKGPQLIKYAYSELIKNYQFSRPVQFMVGGIDFKRTVRDKEGRPLGVAIFDRILFRYVCPDFALEEAKEIDNPVLVMGSGEPAIEAHADIFKKLQFDVQATVPLAFQGFLIVQTVQDRIKKLKIETVGGLYQMVIMDINGVGFVPYKTRGEDTTSEDLDLELIIRSERLIQRNIQTGKEMPLLFPPEVVKESIKDPSVELFADIE